MRFPHPLTLLVGCVILAAVLTHIVPAGEYDRREDPVTGRMVVVPGSYHAVEANPLGVLETGLAIPKGMIEAASVLVAVKRDQAARTGEPWSADREAAIRTPIVEKYEREGSPYYSTARLWDDGLIDPVATREALSLGLSAAANAPVGPPKFGVFRM